MSNISKESNSINGAVSLRNYEHDRPTASSEKKKGTNLLALFLVLMIGICLMRLLFTTIKGTATIIPTFESLLLRLQDFSAIDITALQIGTLAVDWGMFQFLATFLNIILEIVNVITLVFMGLVQVLALLLGMLTWIIGI